MALSNHGAERTDAGTSLNPKEMQQAYEIRAALEEVGGRAAAPVLKGNTAAHCPRSEKRAPSTHSPSSPIQRLRERGCGIHRNMAHVLATTEPSRICIPLSK